jgi:NDP-sugar pyrophosphorylase family protein
MRRKEITGVILAAGYGSRIKQLSTHLPKPMLPICNKPILQYHVEMMRDLGIKRIIIVVGHLKELIMDAFGDGSRLGVKIDYVEQKDILGIAHAAAQVENELDSPFMMTLGDIFFVPKDLDRLVETFRSYDVASVLAVKREPRPEYIRRNFAVQVTDGRLVRRVIEKPRYVENDLKGCGMYLFSLNIFDAIRRTPRTAMRDEYEITDSIQILIDDGFPVFAEEVIIDDINITYVEDLLNCSQMWMKYLETDNVVADSARLADGVRLESCVIGENVQIDQPILVKNSVIFPGERITEKEDVLDCVVTEGRQVR